MSRHNSEDREKSVKIYSSSSSSQSIYDLFLQMVSDLINSQSLAVRLTIRDIKGMYRQSLLGGLWAFIPPLVNTLVWIFLTESGIVKTQGTVESYMFFIFSGTIIWSVFTESILMPLVQTQSAKSILAKVNFPKEALLLSGLYKVLFNTGIKLLLVFIVMFFLDIDFGWRLLFFPFALFSLIFIGMVIGFFFTPIGMLYQDIGRGIPLVLQLLMYVTPIVYNIPASGYIKWIMIYNPLSPIVMFIRASLTNQVICKIEYLIMINLIAIIIGLVGWMFYRLSIPIIVERTSD